MKSNLKKLIVVFIVGLTFITTNNTSYSWFKDNIAESVKNGRLSNYPQKTVGEAVKGFIANPKWESIVADDGKSYVIIDGFILLHGKRVKVSLQYKVNKDDSFEFNALEFNEIPQNLLMYAGLLEKMYE